MAQDVEVIVLDSDDDAETPKAAAAREAAQRKMIMEFARAKRQRIDTTEAGAAANAANVQAMSISPQSPPSAPSRVCNKIAKAATAGGTGCANEESFTSTSGTVITNSMLKDLHEARMERLKAQQAATTAGNRHGSSADQAGGSADQAQHHSDGHVSEQVTSSLQKQAIGASNPGLASKVVTLLTYNVW